MPSFKAITILRTWLTGMPDGEVSFASLSGVDLMTWRYQWYKISNDRISLSKLLVQITLRHEPSQKELSTVFLYNGFFLVVISKFGL